MNKGNNEEPVDQIKQLIAQVEEILGSSLTSDEEALVRDHKGKNAQAIANIILRAREMRLESDGGMDGLR